MSNPFNLFIATSVVLFLVYRVFVIVRESVVEVAPSNAQGSLPRAIVDGALRAGGRLLVLFVTALAISSAITVARQAPTLSPLRSATAPEVVTLEPVVVSISSARFEEIRAEEAQSTRLAQRAPAHKSS